MHTGTLKFLSSMLLATAITVASAIAHQATNPQQDSSTPGKSSKRSSKRSRAANAADNSSATASASGEKSGKQAPAGGAKVDLNTATQSQLEVLPGVGAATAKKIIAGRPYSSASDLSKAGVSSKTISAITPMVVAGGTSGGSTAASPVQRSNASQPKTATSKIAGSMTNQQGGPGMVWVNPETKVFHRAGDRWYGKTKNGQYMTESDAVKAGYRESKQKGSTK